VSKADDVINPTFDGELFTITFCGTGGRKLICSFGGNAFGDCTFSGEKASAGTQNVPIDI